ncbi:hypothetical protein V6N11_067553 [Hibiscus sabdariffa]|uniref:Uncharacterized protein n=1 Tax=Hibiscus sabdariffa TaxID=183260 RepID=A0ABR2SR75_9ROSI
MHLRAEAKRYTRCARLHSLLPEASKATPLVTKEKRAPRLRKASVFASRITLRLQRPFAPQSASRLLKPSSRVPIR